jgi:hypothetical protein
MSVFSFPRIYFKAYASWDPCTFHNNDWQAFQTYESTNAALSWDFGGKSVGGGSAAVRR